jgi:outer membrane protein assembly factor BamA
MLALILTTMLLVPAQDQPVELAEPVAPVEPTRSEELRAAREEKAQRLEPPRRSSLEKALYEFKERRIMERFQAGFAGFHPLVGGMKTGSGFALGASRDIAKGLKATGQLSVKGYQKYEVLFSKDNLLNRRLFAEVRTTYRSHSQEVYFGTGNDTRSENQALYRMEDRTVGGQVGVRLMQNVKVGAHSSWVKTTVGNATTPHLRSVGEVFDAEMLTGLDGEPTYLRSGAFVDIDSRDEPGNPRSGGRYAANWSVFKDQDFGRYGFTQYEAEVQQYIPFFHQRRVIALRAKTTLIQTADGQKVPFYMLPTLGGSEDLRGYQDFRFRDKNMVVVNAEYRWEAFSGLDVALFADAGQVAPRAQDLRLGDMKTSAGFGFRFNTAKGVIYRIDVGFSRESTRVSMKFGNVF